jgi:Tol biopolymer transport system component
MTQGNPPTTAAWIHGRAVEYNPRFSPDGRWIAYSSNDSGQFQIYLQPYPAGERLTVSIEGGQGPVWGRDGKELFFYGAEAGVEKLMSVRVTPEGQSLRLGKPVGLFGLQVRGSTDNEERYRRSGNWGWEYDVMPDGRFIMIKESAESSAREIVVVKNWLHELERLVSTE